MLRNLFRPILLVDPAGMCRSRTFAPIWFFCLRSSTGDWDEALSYPPPKRLDLNPPEEDAELSISSGEVIG